MVLQKLRFSAPPYTEKIDTALEESIRNSWSGLRQNLKEFEKLEQLRFIYPGIKISTFPVKGDLLSVYKFDQPRFTRNIFRQDI